MLENIESYLPQIMEQITEGVQDDFDNLCAERGINKRLLELEEILGLTENGGLSSEPLDPDFDKCVHSESSHGIISFPNCCGFSVCPSSLPGSVDPEEAMREQAHQMKREEHKAILAQLLEVENQNMALLAEVRAEEKECTAALDRITYLEKQLVAASNISSGLQTDRL